MRRAYYGFISGVATFACLAQALSAAANAAVPAPLKVTLLGFEAPTNVSALTIRGESTEAKASVELAPGANLLVKQLKVVVPVESLKTGMSLRDTHMRERIFKTEDGKSPDVELVAKDVECKGTGDKFDCPVKGTLSIRGVAKPVEFPVVVRTEGGKRVGSGQTLVKLSTYGIKQPSQLGVTVKDEVTIRFEAAF